MPYIELLTIEDTFWLSRNELQMLILHPNLSVPKDWQQRDWNKRKELVFVVKPDGQKIKTTAQFDLSHFNIRGPKIDLDKSWRITVWLTDKTKDEVPVGSKLLVSEHIRDVLLPKKTV
jgi:hypothetical protein